MAQAWQLPVTSQYWYFGRPHPEIWAFCLGEPIDGLKTSHSIAVASSNWSGLAHERGHTCHPNQPFCLNKKSKALSKTSFPLNLRQLPHLFQLVYDLFFKNDRHFNFYAFFY